VISLFGAIGLIAADYFAEIKTYHGTFVGLVSLLVAINSVSVCVVIYMYKKSVLAAVAAALVLPIILFGYPAVTDYLDMYRARHDPNSFYYSP
jgi:hypothetical protein